MDSEHFDRLAIALGRQIPRRSLLGLLGGLGLTRYVTREVAAQECLPDGTRCGGERGTCCSGWCKRKHGTNKRFCRAAPDQGTCNIGLNFCNNNSPLCDSGSQSCVCYVTNRGYSVCGQSPAECFACETDAHCEKRPGGQAGDHCIDCADCAGAGTDSRACVHRCGDPATV
jgi:hypothetical protein